jgi:hypothetical protein
MAAAPDTAAAKGGFRAWLNKRLPVDEFVESQLTGYFAPKNFNLWYFFGALAMLVFVIQILSGIFLTMHYKPSLQLGRVHHARGRVGLAHPLHALDGRLVLLRRRLSAHVPRDDVRLVPCAA